METQEQFESAAQAVTFGDREVQAGFTPMPNQILIHSPELGADEMLVYLAIASFAWGDKDTAFSGNESIAGRARMSVKRVIAAKRRLVGAGYLEEKRRGLGMTNLHVLWLKSRCRTASGGESRVVDSDSSRTEGRPQTKTDKVNTDKVNHTSSFASAAPAAPAARPEVTATAPVRFESGRSASAGVSASKIERPTAAQGRAAGAELLEREFQTAGFDGLLPTLAGSAWAQPMYAPAGKARLREMRRGRATLTEMLEFVATDPTTVGWAGTEDGSSNMEHEEDF